MSKEIRVIPSSDLVALKKQAKALKKSNDIPHHEALDILARNQGFSNWEHLKKAHNLTDISEQAYRTGLVLAMDVKDVYDNPSTNDQIIEDDQLELLFHIDFLRVRKYKSKEELTEEDRYFLEDLSINCVFFRYSGKIPSTIKQAFEIAENEFFFAPTFVWLKGVWYDQFGKFNYDEYLEEVKNADPF